MIMLPDTSYAADSPDFSIDPSTKVADPDTSSHMGFNDMPGFHDGRIWIDKSVVTGTGADDFTITLSALSQSFYITDGYVIPADTTFIIDVSGSMYQESIGGRPRIAALVEALNEAIGILMDANPQNRVAVVAYGGISGGYSRVVDVLPLGRPPLMPDATYYFSYRHAGGTSHYVDVHTTNRLTDSVLVQGSTPTQRGIYNGANILISAGDLTIDALDAAGEPVFDTDGVTPLKVTRKPNIILMTDGEPTMAWNDYLFSSAPTNENQAYGDGSFGETGVSLLTILTAAHRKRLVQNHYFRDNPDHALAENAANEGVGFYTISLNDVPAPDLIAATMFPFDPGNTDAPGYADAATTDLNPNATTAGIIGKPYPSDTPADSIGNLLRAFTDPLDPSPTHQISFLSQHRGTLPGWWVGLDWEELIIGNYENLTLAELAFSDRFFPAGDLQTLRDAFLSITTDIQRESFENIITDAELGNGEFDGYLVFSDVLGEYMEFREITGLYYNNDALNYDRTGFGPAVIADTDGAREDFADILYHHLNYGDPDSNVSLLQVRELIQSNIESGQIATNNSIKYYAFEDRDFACSFFDAAGAEVAPPSNAAVVVELFPMWGDIGTPVIAGGQTNLMYVAFHVITVINDNTVLGEIFNTDGSGSPLARAMNSGDQLIRWYIPAILIPQRSIDPDTGVLSGNLLPIRVQYMVGLNEARINAGVSPEYRAANQVPGEGNENAVYFYTNRHPRNVTLDFYRPHRDNPYYHPGRPGYNDSIVVKTDNPTGTAPHVTLSRHSTSRDGRMDLHWLGNNGRLTVTFDNPPEPPPITPPPPPTGPPPLTPPPMHPEMGDASNMVIWLIILASSLFVILIALLWRIWQ